MFLSSNTLFPSPQPSPTASPLHEPPTATHSTSRTRYADKASSLVLQADINRRIAELEALKESIAAPKPSHAPSMILDFDSDVDTSNV
jgi:hypothetical protein